MKVRRNKSELPESQDIWKDEEDGETASTHTPLPPPIALAGVGSLEPGVEVGRDGEESSVRGGELCSLGSQMRPQDPPRVCLQL